MFATFARRMAAAKNVRVWAAAGGVAASAACCLASSARADAEPALSPKVIARIPCCSVQRPLFLSTPPTQAVALAPSFRTIQR